MPTFTLPTTAAGKRLDVALTEVAGMSRSQVQKLIRANQVTIGKQVVGLKFAVAGGEEVTISEPAAEQTPAVPDLHKLYEDDDVVVIDKPAGLIVHPSETKRIEPSVAAWAAAQGVRDDDTERPGIVHRLDKETSGVMVVAKHPEAKAYMQHLFKSRKVIKRYTALVRGRLAQSEAVIRLPIGRNRSQPLQRAVVAGGREATTHYRVIAEYPGASLVEVDLQTGRTHQIRVHFSHLGHPVVGDRLYGGAQPGLGRQFLHASYLSFTPPSGQTVAVTSPLPADLQTYLDHLGSGV